MKSQAKTLKKESKQASRERQTVLRRRKDPKVEEETKTLKRGRRKIPEDDGQSSEDERTTKIEEETKKPIPGACRILPRLSVPSLATLGRN